MIDHASSRRQGEASDGGYYTSGDLDRLEQVCERVHARLASRNGAADGPDPSPELRTRVARAVMDLVEAGIEAPDVLEDMAVRSVERSP